MTGSGTYEGTAPGFLSATLLPRAAYDVAYTPTAMVAGFAFDIQTGNHAFASDRLRPFLTLPHSLAFTPAGCDILSRSAAGGEYLTVAVTPGAEHLVSERAARARQFTNGLSPEAAHWARCLRALLIRRTGDPVAMEEAAAMLFDRALALAGKSLPPPTRPASSLTRARLGRLHDLVEARFRGPLSLADMAAELGLSLSFFVRAFRAATGLTPHAYLMERRLVDARARLAAPGAVLADVALACGFSSQAHMSTAFRDRLGISPGQYRASLG